MLALQVRMNEGSMPPMVLALAPPATARTMQREGPDIKVGLLGCVAVGSCCQQGNHALVSHSVPRSAQELQAGVIHIPLPGVVPAGAVQGGGAHTGPHCTMAG